MLSLAVFLPLLGMFVVLALPARESLLRAVALITTGLTSCSGSGCGSPSSPVRRFNFD